MYHGPPRHAPIKVGGGVAHSLVNLCQDPFLFLRVLGNGLDKVTDLHWLGELVMQGSQDVRDGLDSQIVEHSHHKMVAQTDEAERHTWQRKKKVQLSSMN